MSSILYCDDIFTALSFNIIWLSVILLPKKILFRQFNYLKTQKSQYICAFHAEYIYPSDVFLSEI